MYEHISIKTPNSTIKINKEIPYKEGIMKDIDARVGYTIP